MIDKHAQTVLDAKFVANQIRIIIDIMLSKISQQARPRSYQSIRTKIKNLNVAEMASKRTVGGAPIGTSISLIKNILNGRDPYFIQMVLNELGART